MLKKKIICILLAIILITGTSIISLASDVSNNVNDQKNTETNSQSGSNLNTNEINEINEQRDDLKEKLEEANKQLEYVQGEMSTTLLEIQKLSDKIAGYESENAKLGTQLAELEKSINETTSLLSSVTEEYNKREEQLRERLVTIYEEGELSYLDVLLSSSSLSEMLSRYYVMQEIAEYDNELIDKVAEEKNTIELSQKKLENETTQVKILKARAEQTEIVLKNTKTLQEGYITQLSESEKKLNDEIEKYKIENAKLEAKLQELSSNIEDFEIQYTGGDMIWPIAKAGTYITSPYGNREHPIYGIIKLHQGIDIGNAGFGAPTVAALDGVVTYAGWLGSYGNCVMIYHGEGITTLYGHGQKVLTQKGASVKQGDLIMEVGSTGNSTGPHLHFEVRVNGRTVNPLQFVKTP